MSINQYTLYSTLLKTTPSLTGIVITDLDDSEDEETRPLPPEHSGIIVPAAVLGHLRRHPPRAEGLPPLRGLSREEPDMSKALVLFRPLPPVQLESNQWEERDIGSEESVEDERKTLEDDAMDVEM